MWAVAIQSFEGDEERRAAAIASAAGLSLYEGRLRARAPGPRLVASYGASADAERVAEALARAGLGPLVLGPHDLVTDARRAIVRTFQLGPSALEVALRDGRSFEAPYGAISVLLRGTRIRQQQHTEVTHERTLKLGPTLLTGIPMTSKERKEKTVTQETREGFLHVVAPGIPELAFHESFVLYTPSGGVMHPESLGHVMKLTRTANFAQLVQELRARAPLAAYDERLLTRAGQVLVLGGVLAPEPYLDLATTLLTRTLGAASTPYR